MPPDTEPTVKISMTAIYELVVSMKATLEQIVAESGVQRDKSAELDRRIQNHGDRIRDLEATNHQRSDHGAYIKELRESVDLLEAAVNRSSWLPVLATGVLVSVIGGIIVAVVLKGA